MNINNCKTSVFLYISSLLIDSKPCYYYFFYNWKVTGKDCVGKRIPVPVTVDYDPNCIAYQGIEEGDILNDLTIYPNPSDGQFNVDINLNASGSVSFRIIDAKGQLVYTKYVNEMPAGQNIHQIDAKALSSGFYMLQVTGDDINESRRIVIR